MPDAGSEELVHALVRHLASGQLQAHHVLPAIQRLCQKESPPASIPALLSQLEGDSDPDIQKLVRHLHDVRRIEALRFNRLRREGNAKPAEFQIVIGDLPLDAPLGWKTSADSLRAFQTAFSLLRDHLFLSGREQPPPRITGTVEKKFLEAMEALSRPPSVFFGLSLPELASALTLKIGDTRPDLRQALEIFSTRTTSSGDQQVGSAEALLDRPEAWLSQPLDEESVLRALRVRLEKAEGREEQKKLLDMACTWPTSHAASLLLDRAQETWADERVSLILALRFGQPAIVGWNAWQSWLREQVLQAKAGMDTVEQLVRSRPGEALLLWCHGRPDCGPALVRGLERWCREEGEPMSVGEFVRRWGEALSSEERTALTGAPQRMHPAASASAPAPPIAAVQSVSTPEVHDQARAAHFPAPPVRSGAPPPPSPVPTLWDTHIVPFLVENWYMVAGIAMVIVGSSLLAYYTWDKHWLVRYTVMPALLGLFTASLARAGGWIERKDSSFRGTAATLRGAAIGLLPINFMAVALLAHDEQVSHRVFAVPFMGVLYVLLFGWGLKAWCSAVHPALGWLLGGILLLLNGLVTVGPLTRAISSSSGGEQLALITAGFHLGFAGLAWAVVRFSRRVLTRDLVEEKTVPWFFGATLVATFIQVFAWVHATLRDFPRPSAYAAMTILTGWLVLFVERRGLELRDDKEAHGAESFLGFAFVICGVLMGASDPLMRLLVFALSGTVWLYQAAARRHPLHFWIGLTLLALAGASVGLLEGFPGPWLPGIGLALSVLLGLAAALALRCGQQMLSEACAGMQIAVLILTSVVAVLAQWHFRSVPLATAGCLLAVAALFACRAVLDQGLRWVHSAAAIVALALPYLGCADLDRRSLHGNTMVFGLAVLSLLWLGLNAGASARLVRGARSTVLFLYGSLAVVGMVVRVIVEQDAAVHPLSTRLFMEWSGPLLMLPPLILATTFSRSLVPAGMAVFMLVVLFPEMKTVLRAAFPQFTWGSGIGSASAALVLTLLGFILRRWRFLHQLGEGDLYLGTIPFPLRRHDCTLFTIPAIASAFFLNAKVDTWNLFHNLLGGGVGLKTAAAVGMTGVTWTLLAVYLRRIPDAVFGVHLGWLGVVTGLGFGHWRAAVVPHWTWPALTALLMLQTLYFAYRFVLEPRADWAQKLLTAPVRGVLRYSAGVLTVVCLFLLVKGDDILRLGPLMLFLAVQLAWHGLATREKSFGALLFFMACVALLDWTAPGERALLRRLSAERSLTPALEFLLAIQVLHVLLELKAEVGEKLRPLLQPFLFLATLAAAAMSVAAFAVLGAPNAVSSSQFLLFLVLLVVTARAHGAAPLALLAVVLGYVLAQMDLIRQAPSVGTRVALMASPWRLAALALALGVIGAGGRAVSRRCRFLLQGPYALACFRFPSVGWLYVPAVALVVLAAWLHTSIEWLREAPRQLFAPYVGAAAVFLIALSWSKNALHGLAGLFLILGNVHAVRLFAGQPLRAQGLSEAHLLGLGFALTLLQASAVRLFSSREALSAILNRACLVLAGLVLGLLCVKYLEDPDIPGISPVRFAVSGSMALLAGLYFRWAARHPGKGEEPWVRVCEGVYHLGIAMAIGCAALLLPHLRTPATALAALAFPAAYFYLRAELGTSPNRTDTQRYRNSAATLGFVILALYVFKAAFHSLLFPEFPIPVQHYHLNAPVAALVGLMLLRLRALGETDGLVAFCGGLALMASSYFLLTWYPGLSPFDFPMASAWCAVGLAHFWTLVSDQRSPIGTGIQRLAAMGESDWMRFRRWWGYGLVLAAHAAVLWGLWSYRMGPRTFAPLLAGAATLLIHHGVARKSWPYFVLAAVEIAIALHADFFIESYVPKEQVVWVLLGLWAAGLVAAEVLQATPAAIPWNSFIAWLPPLVLAHVLYHDPRSPAGLIAAALGILLAAMTPRPARRAESDSDLLAAFAVWLTPVWLIYFGQMEWGEPIDREWTRSGPVLSAAATLFAVGALARQFQRRLASAYDRLVRPRPRRWDHALAWAGASGESLNRATLGLAFVLAALVQLSHYDAPFAEGEFTLMLGLYAALAATWYLQWKQGISAASGYLMQLCALGFFSVIRRQLMFALDAWNYEYDVWVSLAASFCLTGAKQSLDLQPRANRIPLLATLLGLPAMAVTWVLVHHLGSHMALLVTGLHGVLFTYLGRDDRESPYHAAAVTGFVAFVLIVFRSHFEFEVLHAYVIPVGVGVLVLLHLFGGHMKAGSRNGIRLVTLLAMLGSAGTSALIDDRYPVVFHLTLILLSLLAMGMGSLFKVRLYLVLGFTALITDLASLTTKMLAHMERTSRMTAVGGLVLGIGAALVFGALYYKTHPEALNARLDAWRTRLGQWE
ncbi:MAG: hypothetical protein HYU36_10055 [Planctomycetes bacterium]|nr:hypothetical protein [Planctomycetota bacterium]